MNDLKIEQKELIQQLVQLKHLIEQSIKGVKQEIVIDKINTFIQQIGVK